MPTSSYMPDVTVAIAFNAGYLTPAASRTWTDISTYVELDRGMTINIGRGDERSTADANTLTLTLDNSDGRFTATKTSGPYGANLKLGRPIRVQSDPVDGAIQTEFVGFIDELPLEWQGTDGYSYVTITATSRLSRLGLQAGLRSVIEQAVSAASPVGYYTLGDEAGSTQADDSSGLSAPPLTLNGDPALPVVFGDAIGPATDGLTAAQFAGGQYLDNGYLYVANGSAWSASAFFLTEGDKPYIMLLNDTFPSSVVRVAILSGVATWNMFNTAGGSTTLTGGTGLDDGLIHHVLVTCSAAGALNLYVDGTLVDTGSIAGTVQGVTGLRLGGPTFVSPPAPEDYLVGVIAHAAVFGSALTSGQASTIAAAGFTGHAGELTSARLVRYAGYAGVPSSEVTTETGQTTMAHVDTTDKQVVELFRIVETTEGGFLFDGRDGQLNLHNRAHRLTLSAAYTLDMAQQTVESGYAPKVDRSAIANDVSAANIAGTYTARKGDASSQTDHGVATMSIETASEDDDEPTFQAGWALLKYKDPTVRVPSLTVQALAQVGKTPNCSTVMATNPGDKITVSNHPSQAASSSASFFVEGYTKVYGPESLLITFNLSPASPEDTTFVVGSATRGVVGTNPIAL